MRKDKEKIRAMFDSIAPRYDFLNHFLSLGIDKRWRKKVVEIVRKSSAVSVIDVATGTGDLAIAIAKSIDKCNVTAVDISPKMLEIAKQKMVNLELDKRVSCSIDDALQLSFADNSFDAMTISFGVRNFEDLDRGLKELLRVVKPGGRLVILEISTPKGIMAKPYMFYFKTILPNLGKLISKDKSAYAYLSKSVVEFPSGTQFVEKLRLNGYNNVEYMPLMRGVAAIYTANK